jgi:glutathione peroxidase
MDTSRRQYLILLGLTFGTPALAGSPDMSRPAAYAFSFVGLHGGDIRLIDHAAKPMLIVNTASLCGYTPQYTGLEQLWQRYRTRGLFVLGVPSNDFGGQEPGGTDEIDQLVHGQYAVTFPISTKVVLKGQAAHPFYQWAAFELPLETPRWNFHKYLVGRDGHLKAAFPSAMEPTDPRITSAIEKELAE